MSARPSGVKATARTIFCGACSTTERWVVVFHSRVVPSISAVAIESPLALKDPSRGTLNQATRGRRPGAGRHQPRRQCGGRRQTALRQTAAQQLAATFQAGLDGGQRPPESLGGLITAMAFETAEHDGR